MSKKNKYQASASYARGVLTIDLPRAKEPVLWRQEIRDVSRISFALQVLPSGERALVLRADGGAEQIIATFGDQAAADEALVVLREILLKPPSIIPGQRGIMKILKWLLIILAAWWAIQFAIRIYFNYISTKAMQEVETAAAIANEPAEGALHVADDVLQPPKEDLSE